MSDELSASILDQACGILLTPEASFSPELLEQLSQYVRPGIATQIQQACRRGRLRFTFELAGSLFGVGYGYEIIRGLDRQKQRGGTETVTPRFHVKFWSDESAMSVTCHVEGLPLEQMLTFCILRVCRVVRYGSDRGLDETYGPGYTRALCTDLS